MKQQLPEHGSCFVCGTQNTHGIGITWWMEDGLITAEFTLTDAHQGPPNHAHGGASAAILDEAMGVAVWVAGLRVVAVNLEINYRRPVPLGQRVAVRAHVSRHTERKAWTLGEIILPDGTVAVEGRGIYVAAKLVDAVEFKS
jgi:uncharacterized protein (TIGR00369 family)